MESGIAGPEEIVDTFARQFYFGCEADDRLNSIAFDESVVPYGRRLNAMFASDIGHWDVPDVRQVLPEAWSLVEQGQISADEFYHFACGNVLAMLTSMNPAFFEGTAVASAAPTR